jgi:hypothetical protein
MGSACSAPAHGHFSERKDPAMRITVGSAMLAATVLAVVTLSAHTFAPEATAGEIAKNAYPNTTLTPAERGAIAEEEAVTPGDGQPSTPFPADRGIIPDVDEPVTDGNSAATAPAKPKPGESEAEVILNDAKKNDQVTRKDVSDCIGQWDPQTQMSKEEWAKSCRTTLEYFPESGSN